MWSALLVVLMGYGLLVLGQEKALGKGRWLVENLYNCPDPDKYPFEFTVKRRKINRTHDAFYTDLNIPEEITESKYGVYIDVCRKVDGGCKHQYTINKPSFCKFIKKYAEDNFKAILAKAGLEKHDCPIPKVYIDVCRKVDGGCKHQYTINKPSFCKFIKKYAEDNFKAILAKAGLEKHDCPIPKGRFVVSDFVFNYMELPEDGMIGKFSSTAYITKELKRLACISMDFEFISPVPDDDDDE